MGKKIIIAKGLALSALLATGAALYLTKTKPGKQTAKKIKAHAKVIGKKIAAKVEKTKALTEKKYGKIVEEIVVEYAKDKKIAEDAGKKVAKDLKKHWKDVKKAVVKKAKTLKTKSTKK